VSKPRLEPVVVMAAVAARTSRVRIGTAVLLPALRHPVTLAHSLATVDVISGGRLVVGAGVGGGFTPEQRGDWAAAGTPAAARGSRLAEMVRVMKRLWTEDQVSFQGKHFNVENVTLDPKPAQRGGIPILLACHYRTGTDAQYRRAAQLADGIIGITDSPSEYAQVVERVDRYAVEAGRDPSRLERAFYMTVNVGTDAEAAAEADDFLMAYYGVRHWGDRWGPWGAPEAVARRMAEYAGAGAGQLIVRFAAWDQASQLKRFVEEVVPAFHALAAAVT
jgi:alkanesulfonate monooxygenase SsuD/methylene tetrahydromethanopterin reductase-like flavin-dependent oxidoreductase (luciferase family)